MLPSIEFNSSKLGTVGIVPDHVVSVTEMGDFNNPTYQVILKNQSYYHTQENLVDKLVEDYPDQFYLVSMVPKTAVNISSIFSYAKTQGVGDGVNMYTLYMDNNAQLVLSDLRCLKPLILALREGTHVIELKDESLTGNEPSTVNESSKDPSPTVKTTIPSSKTITNK
jgi:hypothetical protein